MTTLKETQQQIIARLNGGEISDQDMIALVGQERFDASQAFDDGNIPTVVYDLTGEARFIHFQSWQDLKFLIERLQRVYDARDENEMAAEIPGKIVPFRET